MYLFLTRTYLGTAIRAISQDRAIMPLMGVNPSRIFLITSALGGALAGLAACLLVLQYDIHPAIGLSFGPITFLICVLGGLGNMLGGFIAAFIFAQFISVGGFFFHLEWGYVIAFLFFIAVMFWRPAGPPGRQIMKPLPWIGLACWRLCRCAGIGNYPLHLMIMCLLWALRVHQLVDHGAAGHGELRPRRLPRHRRLRGGDAVEPLRPLALDRHCRSRLALTALVALVIGYPCFRFKIVGHYFALVTLALSESRAPDHRRAARPDRRLARRHAEHRARRLVAGRWLRAAVLPKLVWFYVILAVWLVRAVGLGARGPQHGAARAGGDQPGGGRRRLDRHQRHPLKLGVTLISALMTSLGGVLYAQYQLYVNPETVSGIGVSLQMVFGVIAGGMFVLLGPTVGAVFTLLLAEGLRLALGHDVHGLDTTIYGLMLVLFIIFMPKGILGVVLGRRASSAW